MTETKRIPRTTLLAVVAVVAAAAFALGRNTTPTTAATPEPATFPAGHPAPTGDLPPGHPPVAATPPQAAAPSVAPTANAPSAATLAWTMPARWQQVPNASSMRLATYRIPRAPGDAEDPEMSVMQAGGSVTANVDRWTNQFADDGKRSAHTETRKVGGLTVTIVEIEGTYGGGMGGGHASDGWGLLGAIVETPDMPHFFKMTGPAKSVKAARADLDALVASIHPR